VCAPVLQGSRHGKEERAQQAQPNDKGPMSHPDRTPHLPSSTLL
jgi:hypothetical protein